MTFLWPGRAVGASRPGPRAARRRARDRARGRRHRGSASTTRSPSRPQPAVAALTAAVHAQARAAALRLLSRGGGLNLSTWARGALAHRRPRRAAAVRRHPGRRSPALARSASSTTICRVRVQRRRTSRLRAAGPGRATRSGYTVSVERPDHLDGPGPNEWVATRAAGVVTLVLGALAFIVVCDLARPDVVDAGLADQRARVRADRGRGADRDRAQASASSRYWLLGLGLAGCRARARLGA